MINQDVASNLRSIISHLKGTNGYHWFVDYFKEKSKEVLEDLLKDTGNLTEKDIVAANAKMQVYDDLINFDILLDNDLK